MNEPRTRRVLVLGCGSKPYTQRVGLQDFPMDFQNAEVVGVDFVEEHKPDVVWDLEQTPWPFKDEDFAEVHAYDVLEHLGKQGDFRGFFDLFSEVHRVLLPGGLVYATVPWWQSEWAFADPGHTRVFPPKSLIYLDQDEYRSQVGRTAMTDYRPWWKGDFKTVLAEQSAETLVFVLQKKGGDYKWR